MCILVMIETIRQTTVYVYSSPYSDNQYIYRAVDERESQSSVSTETSVMGPCNKNNARRGK